MTMQLKILFFDINSCDPESESLIEEENKKEESLSEKIINIFINEKIIEKKSHKDNKNTENNYISFSYKIKSGNTCQIFFYNLNKFDKVYSINLITDAFVILIDIEKENSFEKLNKLILYIKDNCPKEIKTYIFGIYQNKNNIREEFKEIKENLNLKNILFYYEEVYFLIEGKQYKELNDVFENFLFNIYNNKKQLKLIKIPVSETTSFENIKDDDNSKSKCNIF